MDITLLKSEHKFNYNTCMAEVDKVVGGIDETAAIAALDKPHRLLQSNRYSVRWVTVIFAILGGGIGFHRLYLRQQRWLIYLFFSLTMIPHLIALIEALYFAFISPARWDQEYNEGLEPEVMDGHSWFQVFLIIGVVSIVLQLVNVARQVIFLKYFGIIL